SKRMLERDDEDLAIEQIRPAGREDDADLRRERHGRDAPARERGAAELDRRIRPEEAHRELQRRIEALRTAREALPIRALSRLDELDGRARALSAQRAADLDALESTGRLGRRGTHTAESSYLQAAIDIAEQELASINDERVRLRGELGDPEQVRS